MRASLIALIYQDRDIVHGIPSGNAMQVHLEGHEDGSFGFAKNIRGGRELYVIVPDAYTFVVGCSIRAV